MVRTHTSHVRRRQPGSTVRTHTSRVPDGGHALQHTYTLHVFLREAALRYTHTHTSRVPDGGRTAVHTHTHTLHVFPDRGCALWYAHTLHVFSNKGRMLWYTHAHHVFSDGGSSTVVHTHTSCVLQRRPWRHCRSHAPAVTAQRQLSGGRIHSVPFLVCAGCGSVDANVLNYTGTEIYFSNRKRKLSQRM